MNNVGLPEADTGGAANPDHGGASPLLHSILLKRLEGRIKAQARELTYIKEVLQRKNRELDAMYWVWCDGGCPGGVNRWHKEKIVTEGVVEIAERNTMRLRRWWETVKARKCLAPQSETEGEPK